MIPAHERLGGIRRLVAPLVAALALASCNDSTEHQMGQSFQRTDAVKQTLDYSKLTADGQTCQGGAPRPCFAPLRIAPNYEAGYINKLEETDTGQGVVWPYEGGNGQTADAIEIVCQVRGDQVTNASSEASDVWDVIRVPAEYISSGSAQAIESGKLEVGHSKDDQGKLTHAFAYTPDMWLGNKGVVPQLVTCSESQNPGGFPAP